MRGRALLSGFGDPFANLALEEDLLAGPTRPLDAFLLYVDDPCVIVGRSQNPWIEVSPGAGIPVLRRISGGGTVYHDRGNLNWSFLGPRAEHDRRTELAAIVAALALLGVEAAADERGAIRLLGPGSLAGAKVSGSARRVMRDRVLHHGTLLVDADLGRMGSCLGGIEALRGAAPRSVQSRVANLSALVPGIAMGEVIGALSRSISGRESESAESLADHESLRRSELRLRSWDWIWGATPRFSVAIGEAGCVLEVAKGRVASASGPRSEALEGFLGQAFDYAAPELAGAAIARHREG